MLNLYAKKNSSWILQNEVKNNWRITFKNVEQIPSNKVIWRAYQWRNYHTNPKSFSGWRIMLQVNVAYNFIPNVLSKIIISLYCRLLLFKAISLQEMNVHFDNDSLLSSKLNQTLITSTWNCLETFYLLSRTRIRNHKIKKMVNWWCHISWLVKPYWNSSKRIVLAIWEFYFV